MEAELGTLIEERLGEHVRGARPVHAIESQLGLDPVRPMALAVYCALLRTMKRGSSAQQHAAASLHGELMLQLHCGLGNIWRLVVPDPHDEGAAERNFACGLAIAIQRYGDFFAAAETWRAELAAPFDSDHWLALAAVHEAAGRYYQANAALAVAQWLALAAPEADRVAAGIDEQLARRPAALPAALRGQPRAGFRDEPVHYRHWRAWDMKTRGMLDVPALIAYACDESFWVRARIYRSLGQQPMLASAPVLLEGLGDPHPFARAQAARALGWLAVPFAVDRLRALADTDDDREVQRAARQAGERIAAFWVLYGTPCGPSARARFDAAQKLAARGLLGAAGEYLTWADDAGIPRPAYDALARDLAPHALTPGLVTRDYNAYVREAEANEAALERTDPAREPDDMRALYAVSRHRRCAARAADLAGAPGAVGWNARRALRALRLPAT